MWSSSSSCMVRIDPRDGPAGVFSSRTKCVVDDFDIATFRAAVAPAARERRSRLHRPPIRAVQIPPFTYVSGVRAMPGQLLRFRREPHLTAWAQTIGFVDNVERTTPRFSDDEIARIPDGKVVADDRDRVGLAGIGATGPCHPC